MNLQAFDFISILGQYCSPYGSLNLCLQGIYNLIVAIVVALAFIMFLIGAFKNLLSVIPDIKMEGKRQMKNSLIGLIVIFTSGILLYWINPEIFNARLIIFRISKLEFLTINVEEHLSYLKGGGVTDIANEFQQVFPGLKKAIENAVLAEEELNNLPKAIQDAVNIAFSYANTPTGRESYINKYKGEEITSCSHFIYRILKEAKAIPQACPYHKAGQFPDLLTNNQLVVQHAQRQGFKWEKIQFNPSTDMHKLQPGDILVRNPLEAFGGSGHIGIVVPVKTKGGKIALVLAHASIGSAPPRLTHIPKTVKRNNQKYQAFNWILRPIKITH